MRKIIQLRKHILHGVIPLMMGLLLLQVNDAKGQSERLIKYEGKPQLTEKQKHFADAWITLDWVKSYHYISIDVKLFNSNYLNVNLPQNTNLNVEKKELVEHNAGLYSWLGTFQNPLGNADFEVHDDMITARISSFGFVYLIYPITEKLHVLIECNNANMPLDESEEGYKQMLEQGEKKLNERMQKHHDPEAVNGEVNDVQAGDCKVRILVVYDTQASANMADPIAFVNSCINATNTAHNNSAVNFNVELAVAIEETYSEALNSAVDKVRFHDNGDGHLDAVFDYRTYFDADMCILILENVQPGICGEAYTVANSSYNDPFCVVTRGCAVGNLSFPHELGHLYGCRHDPYVDNTNTPYAYGHGYVYLPGAWRTVMAYNNYCSDNGSSCTRIQYFSNPGVNFSGHATGVSGANNNKAALEASRPNISSLETTLSAKVFVNGYTFTSGEQSDVIATSSVTNSTTFAFNSGSSGTWRTGGSCIMAPGFIARTGSTFRAYVDACTTLKPAPVDDPAELTTAKQAQSQAFDVETVQVLPNPFTDNFDMIYYLAQEGNVTIEMYDMLGAKVRELFNQNLHLIGPYKFSFDGSDLKPGMYICSIKTAVGSKTIRVNKVK